MQRIVSTTGAVPLFGIPQTRSIEARAAAALPPHALMQRAGSAVARLALALAPHARRVWVAAGPGNNGGDGLETALCLRQLGKDAGVRLHGDVTSMPPDAKAALARAQQAGVAIDAASDRLERCDLAIDALLGIGASRPPQGRLAETIRRLNALDCPVLSIDVPSGLDADTGQPHGAECVIAQHTLTLLGLKPGLFTAAGRDHAGSVWLDRLGIEHADAPADAVLVGSGSADLEHALRRHAVNKGSFGDVAVVGGATSMIGAALLAARAAHAAGAGRVHVALLAANERAPDHDPVRPELMFRAAWCDAPAEVLAAATVVCGCGGGDAVRAVLPRLISLAGRLVLDADALNAIAADPGLQSALRTRAGRGHDTVLTPHPLEAARLLGCSSAEVQADR
ncbi:MAG: NAD(P)H-hydrate epimerase, partial [Caldimonas sp.]